MIRFIRQQAVENRWVLGAIMGVIIVTFVVGLGYMGFSSRRERSVATVADTPIPLQDYVAVYRSTYSVYQNMFKDQFTPELIEKLDLRHMALNQLIDLQLWRLTAQRLGLSVSDDELKETLLKNPAFQRAGQFDPYVYEQTLLRNNWTPQRFEEMERLRILADKAKAAVRTAVLLLPEEMPAIPASPAQPSGGAAGESPATPPAPTPAETLLQQKEERVLMAFLANLRGQTPITINEQML